jgi:hypothetical protein
MAASNDERRRFSRVVFHRPAQVDAGAERATCEVLDVSLKGALVEAPFGFRAGVGEPCTLTIRLDAGEAAIRMEGEIVHRQGMQLGIRCKEIDLDSIAHLRRLVELNVGDDELLQRELAALVSKRE